MKKFNKTIELNIEYLLAPPPDEKCIIENVMFHKDEIITEMQNEYPVTKNVLSYFVEKTFKGGFSYIEEITLKQLIELSLSSDNIKDVKFDIENIEQHKSENVLFICLPYRLEIWKTELEKFFEFDAINKMFIDFNNAFGCHGTYSRGNLIIINSDYLNSLKDIEEIVEHELIQLYQTIDNYDTEISNTLQNIVHSKYEYVTFVSNALNRLEKIYNRFIIENTMKDSNDRRIEFLNELFKDAETMQFEKMINKYSVYDSSKLLDSNLWFFQQMCLWKPNEFEDFKKKIYDHFKWF